MVAKTYIQLRNVNGELQLVYVKGKAGTGKTVTIKYKGLGRVLEQRDTS